MSSDRHAHKHCPHTHVSYCATCQVVYCHDCTQEWTPKATWWVTSGTYSPYGTTSDLGYKTMTNANTAGQLNPLPHRHGG